MDHGPQNIVAIDHFVLLTLTLVRSFVGKEADERQHASLHDFHESFEILAIHWRRLLVKERLDTSAFMEQFGLPSKTRTKDGYNPLLDDFKNTKFYLSVPTYNIK
uniref:Uncharacterized protein n=1 Tax=Chenopodium quinoa TaxID=63459 RepID=A0A803MNR8_CHEQI